MLRYYLELFQCPTCRKGAWSLVEVLIRSCLFNEGFCHQISENIGSKMVHLTLLKFFFHLLESEVRHLSQKLCDWSSSQSLKETEKGILLEIFWSGSETSGLLTKPVNMLLEWTIYSHKEKCKSNDVSWITLQNNMIYGKFSFPSLSVGFINMDSPSSYRNTQKSILPTEHVQTVIIITSAVWYSNHVTFRLY